MNDTIKPQTPENLPEPEILQPVNTFRHYSDDFSEYILGKHRIPIPRFSYTQTKELRKIASEFDKAVILNIENMKNNINSNVDSILDKEDEFIERFSKFVFPQQVEAIMNDPEVSRGSLFQTCKELFSFLVAMPVREELTQLGKP